MLKKLALAAVVLAASLSFTIATVHADGALCGPGSNPSLICSATPPPPSPDLEDLALSLVADVLAIIP